MPVTGAETERDLRYTMAGNRIRLVTNLVEVYPPSGGSVDLGGLTVERCSPRPKMG